MLRESLVQMTGSNKKGKTTEWKITKFTLQTCLTTQVIKQRLERHLSYQRSKIHEFRF